MVVVLGSVTGNLAGGYYALMPFMWLFIAYIDNRALEDRPAVKKAPILDPAMLLRRDVYVAGTGP
jgi:hypothetical protein